MRSVLLRRASAIALFAALVVAALVVPMLAFAVPVAPGESPGTAVPIPSVGFVVTGTLIPVPTEAAEFWYTLPMTKGQTIEATLTADSAVGFNLLFYNSTFADTPFILESDHVSATVSRLTMMAPASGSYWLSMYGEKAGDFTLEATNSATPVSFRLYGLGLPKKSVKPKRSFTLSALLAPEYDSLTSPIKFVIERRGAHKRFKPFGSANATKISGTTTVSKLSATAKISKKGYYRIRARFADADHGPKYTPWKYMTIK